MFQHKNKKLTQIISQILVVIFLITPFFVAEKSLADSADENVNENAETEEEIFSSQQTVGEIENQIANNQKEWKDLQEQRNYYLSILKEKQEERMSLENQISILDAQISKAELEIKTTQSEIEKTILEIQKITLEIQKKEEEIIHQKKVIGELLRKIYEYDEKTLLETLLENDTLSEFLDQKQYIESFQEEIKNTLDKIKDLKEQLEFKREEMKAKKSELEELKENLEKQKAILENEKKSKEVLLEQTKGQERTYQNLLSRIKEQKNSILGDIDRLMREKQKELARIEALQSKPKTGLASGNWYFSQSNPLWAYDTIGFSNSSMKRFGCAVTCVAMVFKHHGINVDPGYLARQQIFSFDLIVWPNQWSFLDRNEDTWHRVKGLSIKDWQKIDKEIASGHPVIIFIRVNDGTGRGHYVVIHSKDATGRYVVHDPIKWAGKPGANIYLDSTRKYLSYVYNGATTTIDQMIIYH